MLKKTSPAYNQFEVWKGIKDEVNKVGLTRSLLKSNNKIRNSKEVYKKAKKKADSPGAYQYRTLTIEKLK